MKELRHRRLRLIFSQPAAYLQCRMGYEVICGFTMLKPTTTIVNQRRLHPLESANTARCL